MAVVPYTSRGRSDPVFDVSNSHSLMALGELYQRGMLVSNMFEPPAEPSNQSKAMKNFIEDRRKAPGKSFESDIEPGEDIVDRERGPQSGRTVKRL